MADFAEAGVKKERKASEHGVGVVKAVPAGDTVVILQREGQGLPKERDITLTNIKAPRVGRKTATGWNTDEPFAFQSREFLRKKVIGKQVSFISENKASNSNKEYGYVYLLQNGKEPENLAKALVGEGWADLRPVRDPERPELQELAKLEEKARSDGRGIHKKDAAPEATVRPINHTPSNTVIFEKFKGRVANGIVEQVITGSTLRVLLLPDMYEIRLLLSGAEAPATPRDDQTPEPYSREAKFFSEHFILHRDVQITLEGADQSTFYGTVICAGHNIGEELLKIGLAKYVDWSGARSSTAAKLRAAEASAKEKKLRKWIGYVEPAKALKGDEKGKPRSGRETQGKVVDIQTLTSFTVVDNQGNEIKVNLSSIRPRGTGAQRGKDAKEKDEREKQMEKASQFEAKEFLRKKLIGQRVRLVFDYGRASDARPGQPAPATPLPDRGFYTVYLEKQNVAVLLVENGYAEPVFHRPGEARARDFEDIMAAEGAVSKGKKEVGAIPHINDLTQPPVDVAKSRAFLPSLKRAGRARGVVEFEFSSSRFKVYVPKEQCQIIIALAGVKTPRQGEEFADNARKLARDLVHQHDIEFEVFQTDRGGNFIGNVWVNKRNVATALLEEGYATIQRVSLADTGCATEYTIAEEHAKKGKKNLWKNYDEVVEEAARLKRLEEKAERDKPKQDLRDVIVTEIVDASSFFVQIVGPEAEQLEDLMKVLSEQAAQGPHSPAVGEIVSAQFTEDDAWYRAKVTAVKGGQIGVFYVDYGNAETLPSSRLRPLPVALPKLEFQAHSAQLAYINAPKANEDYGAEAAEYLKDLVWGKTMVANIEYREESKLYLTMLDRETDTYVNSSLLKAGLARVEKLRGRHLQPVLDKLREDEEVARKSHSGFFTYGDPGSDEDDEGAKSFNKF